MEGIAARLGSENGSRYRVVSQLQSHQSRYSVQLSEGNSQYDLHPPQGKVCFAPQFGRCQFTFLRLGVLSRKRGTSTKTLYY